MAKCRTGKYFCSIMQSNLIISIMAKCMLGKVFLTSEV